MTERKPWNHRSSSKDRGYGREYRRLRKILLAREPLCRPCSLKGRTTVAVQVDHITPIAKGGATHDIENLQPICADCHRDKCALDKGHRVKPRITESGWPEE